MTKFNLLPDKPEIIIDKKSMGNLPASYGQCDACASVGFNTIPRDTSLVANTYIKAPNLAYMQLDTSDYYTVYSPLLIASPVVLNKKALALVDIFKTPHPLDSISPSSRNPKVLEDTLKQMVNLGLLVPRDDAPLDFRTDPITLVSWLHVTNRCNLRCSYCYLPHTPMDMPKKIGKAAIDATLRSAMFHNYKRVKLKYAGGEPLIRFPYVTDIHLYAQNQAALYGLDLEGVILSNGTYLTPQIVEKIKLLDLDLTISLDSLEGRQRFDMNNKESSSDTIKAIELALEKDLVPRISVTVTGRSAEDLPSLIAWIIKRDLPFSINFYRKNNLSVSHPDLQLEEQKIIKGMLSTFQVIAEHTPRRSLLHSLVDRANLAFPHLYSCGAGLSYLVFDCKGNISKCQMQMQQKIASIIDLDPLALVREDRTGIQNIPVDRKEDCHACVWKYWCAGGCPLSSYRATGSYKKKSPNCNIYRALYPEVFRLEGLRLLKYHRKNN